MSNFELVAHVLLFATAIYGVFSLIFEHVKRTGIKHLNYISRVFFRLFLIVHLITIASLPFSTENKYLYVVSKADEVTILFSLLLLAKSFQDFLEFTGRQNVIIPKIWPFVSIILLCVNCTLDIISSVAYIMHGSRPYFQYIYIYLKFSHFLVVVFFISIPIIRFLFQIKKTILSSNLKIKITLFIILMTFFIIVLVITHLFYIVFYLINKIEIESSSSPGSSRTGNILIVSNIFSSLISFLIQDAIGWTLNWVLIENDCSSDTGKNKL